MQLYKSLDKTELDLLTFWRSIDRSFNYTDHVQTARHATKMLWNKPRDNLIDLPTTQQIEEFRDERRLLNEQHKLVISFSSLHLPAKIFKILFKYKLIPIYNKKYLF
jgi:hypothetical protein